MHKEYTKIYDRFIENQEEQELTPSDFIDEAFAFFYKHISYDWSKLEEAMYEEFRDFDKKEIIDYLFNYVQGFLEQYPQYFSEKLTKLSKRTGLFESFENNDRGGLKKIEEEILKNDVDDIFVQRVLEFCKEKDFPCEFIRKITTKMSDKPYLNFKLGGVNVIVEWRDHIRLWMNDVTIERAFANRTHFYELQEFIDFYNENHIDYYVNMKTKQPAKLGIFEK